MSEIVELNENSNYYTVLLEKNIAGCQQTFWSGDNRLSPDQSLLIAGCHQTLH